MGKSVCGQAAAASTHVAVSTCMPVLRGAATVRTTGPVLKPTWGMTMAAVDMPAATSHCAVAREGQCAAGEWRMLWCVAAPPCRRKRVQR